MVQHNISSIKGRIPIESEMDVFPYTAQDLEDLALAHEYQGFWMPDGDLLKLLGMQWDEDGRVDSRKLYNACLLACFHPNVRMLDQATRVRVLATAERTMDELWDLRD